MTKENKTSKIQVLETKAWSTPEELVNRLIGIACYYRDEYNN